MLLSIDKKFICLNPPKTGSGYREIHLNDFAIVSNRDNRDLKCRHWNVKDVESYLAKNNINPDVFTWFTFVRNPWDRIVSWYNMIVNHTLRDNKHITRDDLLTEESFTKFIRSTILHNQLDDYMIRQGQEIDFVGSLENINTDLSAIIKRLNLDIDALKTHKPFLESYHDDINALWTPETIDSVAKVEANVINKFNYKFKG